MAFARIDESASREAPHPATTKKGHSGHRHVFRKGDTAVSVIVPEHSGLASPSAKSWEGVPTSGVGRQVINLALNVTKDGAKANHFSHPVELRVKMTDADRGNADSKLMVHWHDGDPAQMRWMEIPSAWTEDHEGQKFHKDDEDLVVFLIYWPDDPGVGMDP